MLSAPALESTALSCSPDFKYVNTDSIKFAEGATYGKPLEGRDYKSNLWFLPLNNKHHFSVPSLSSSEKHVQHTVSHRSVKRVNDMLT